jgi:hypothetical protein
MIDKLPLAGMTAALLFTGQVKRFDYTDDNTDIDSSWPIYSREMYGEPERFVVIISIYMHRVRVVALKYDRGTLLKSVVDSWSRIRNSRSHHLCGSVVLGSERIVEAVLSRVRDSEYQEYEILVRIKAREMQERSKAAWFSAFKNMDPKMRSYLSK